MNLDELAINKLENTLSFKERYMNQDDILKELQIIKDKLDRLLEIVGKDSEENSTH